MKRLFIDGVTKRSRKISEVNPRVSIDLEQYIRQVVAAIGGGGGGSYTFENGLTEAATVVKLGGSLTQDTNIDGSSGNFNIWNTNLSSYLTYTTDTVSSERYSLGLNVPSSVTFPLNGSDTLSLSLDNSGGFGTGYFLTEDGLDPRPYIVSEMSYGGGAARTAKVEFSNDYLLNSHKIYDTSNPNGVFREYLTRLGDNQLTLQSLNVDVTNPTDITSNITNTVELSSAGIRFDSASTTGTPTFSYTFPITSSAKPAPAQGHSMVLNSTGVSFDFVKDYKCLGQSLFAVGETVTNKTILLVAPFNNYILESISIISPTGIGAFDLTIQKLSETQTFNINASGSLFKVNTGSIATPIVNNEVISIAVTNVVTSMTQLSVTLNFLYAG
jgi:hypothetical protein